MLNYINSKNDLLVVLFYVLVTLGWCLNVVWTFFQHTVAPMLVGIAGMYFWAFGAVNGYIQVLRWVF